MTSVRDAAGGRLGRAESERSTVLRAAARHAVALTLGAATAYAFWLSRPGWDGEMRFWKAMGAASLVLLLATLAVGPLARLASRSSVLLVYRRELGIWFCVFGALHTVLVLDGWARWDALRFLGYELIGDRLVRLEPGFGLANLVGLAALLISLPLLVTSADWALRALGSSVWKFMHQWAYIVLWLVLLHTAYFLFIHYTEHFHRRPPPPDWFRLPFLVLSVSVLALQLAAFVWTVRQHRRRAVASAAVPGTAAHVRNPTS